uniref:GATA-type domain-containing protein n=1 Tax=Leersia perrieri TaxID=77586 RepID=A0A0D9XKC0_9ORYZ
MVVAVDGLYDDASAALVDEIFNGGDLHALQDDAELDVAARGGGDAGETKGKEVEPERPSNKAATAAARLQCRHCGATKTPWWRSDPDGRRTLCNACGVRYRSRGRLLPEYRPLNSPAFSPEVHSNKHRRVVELRRRRPEPPSSVPAPLSPPPPAVDALRDDAIADELLDGGDFQALLDGTLQGLDVAASGGEAKEGEEEELEWLSNKDAFPEVETISPPPASTVKAQNKTTKPARTARRCRPATGLKCRHCGTTKTPQWRNGPDGRRTLCNACGVYYRIHGRLLPEYRPLNSPTLLFAELPSNRHRLVLQLRRPCAVDDEEEELEWLSNKDAFPTLETMATAPPPPLVAEHRAKKAARRRRPPPPLRCRHCGKTETPQWRRGPDGARTLCNACGVRYRSGRLFPEYRPLNSPTFSPELHSNIHRRVLLLRHHPSPSPPPPPPAVPTPTPAATTPAATHSKKPLRCKQERPASANLAVAAARQCAHCGRTKTWQWRSGPDSGRKLCDPCGKRYRSGRLVLECRPLNGPTFLPEMHSGMSFAAGGGGDR